MKKTYKEFIKKCRNRKLEQNTYTEIHHILPVEVDGDNEVGNLIKLDYTEHCFAHWCCANIYGNGQWIALRNMLGKGKKNSNKKINPKKFNSFSKITLEEVIKMANKRIPIPNKTKRLLRFDSIKEEQEEYFKAQGLPNFGNNYYSGNYLHPHPQTREQLEKLQEQDHVIGCYIHTRIGDDYKGFSEHFPEEVFRGSIKWQGQIIGKSNDFYMVNTFSFLDGRDYRIEFIPCADIYNSNKCSLYQTPKEMNTQYNKETERQQIQLNEILEQKYAKNS